MSAGLSVRPLERVVQAATAGTGGGESVQKAVLKVSSILSTPGKMESGSS